MKRFAKYTLSIFLLLLFILAGSLFLIPDYTARESALAVMPDKHRLLEDANGARIIFLGGSNLCFGMNSKRIADTFNMPVINMGLHAGIGLKYMMQDLTPFIRENDIVVISTEYTDFYTEQYYGNIELVSMLFDIDPTGLKNLEPTLWKKLIPFVFKYAAIKILKIPKIIKYHLSNEKVNEEDIGYYNKYSFNGYGDTYMHWDMENIPFSPYKFCDGTESVNTETISDLKEFSSMLSEKGAHFLILPSVLQATTFNGQAFIIHKIKEELYDNNLAFYKEPERYRFADSLFFNTPYHLNRKGIDQRTSFFIEDIKGFLSEKK